MDKAFDGAALVEMIKKESGPEAEKHAKKIVNTVFNWLNESAALSENAIVKMAVPPAVSIIQPMVMGALDQVDGIKGN